MEKKIAEEIPEAIMTQEAAATRKRTKFCHLKKESEGEAELNRRSRSATHNMQNTSAHTDVG
jgi:hypothetical protein